jgi:soluble lytic murein transglycosylase-like protein
VCFLGTSDVHAEHTLIQHSLSCLNLIQKIAQHHEIPEQILRAIVQVESGFNQQKQPWPWTIRVPGKSYYFKTREAAAFYLDQLKAYGVCNFDIGCCQISWRWHGEQFNHPSELLDPHICLSYAAKILKQFYEQTGSWQQAVALYHSRNPQRQKQYLERINIILNQIRQ